MMQKKILIAITGASGSIYPAQLIDKLLKIKDQWQELSVVATDNAMEVWKVEMQSDFIKKESVRYFHKNDFSAPFASGSGQYDNMIIAPCSMGTLGRIANGISNDLITRAADVVLKERRKLVCLVRETPYNLIHIQNMEKITQAGGIICPATPSFYSVPKTIEEVAATVTDRLLDLIGLNVKSFRWGQ
ncbi:MAG TPA: UbiX family flavin prenyltransferase [Niabella sp.]|nr:UbiX family flavin prenyltransferase [Niabella sp.]HOZ97913.1 UbiX family flavin prenyltransferase [Niabella sp.]HQW15941.1 UbiX family flavin prenyltransferase [Niabella sp.]HQX21111.1 UbiX family flavin prenyltransferase [Niabella sp.]HQX40559.1 UbiX family flavin prenyltransferase [Niabella sp.]